MARAGQAKASSKELYLGFPPHLKVIKELRCKLLEVMTFSLDVLRLCDVHILLPGILLTVLGYTAKENSVVVGTKWRGS